MLVSSKDQQGVIIQPTLPELGSVNLVEGSWVSDCNWFRTLDQPNVTVDDLKCFIKHITYISGKAKGDRFYDNAHVNYELEVRKLAEVQGFSAFTGGNAEIATQLYTIENLRPKHSKASNYNAQRSSVHVKDGKRPCYRWNKDGCSKDETSCGFGHWCARCGAKSHNRIKCARD